MGLGITEEHRALHEAAGRWAADRCRPAAARAVIEGEEIGLPPVWRDLAGQDWLGLHLPEEHGGLGYGLLEVAVVLEELGRTVAPGPFLPTVLASALVAEAGSDTARGGLLPGLADGSTVAAVALDVDGVTAEAAADGLVLDGSVRPVLCAPQADLLVVGGRTSQGDTRWAVVDAGQAEVEVLPAVDASRPLAAVHLDGIDVPATRVLDGLTTERVRDVAAALFAAEAAGVAGWCLDAAVAYAKVREQFGRPIGQFQAVKHRCADMLARVEQARVAAWDAARAAGEAEAAPLTAAVAATLALEAAFRCAEDCVQIHGGIGFTWEHDAHLFLRRATAARQLLGGTGPWRARTAALALHGNRRRLDVDLPASADERRRTVRTFLADIADLDLAERRRRMVDEGYLVPHLPAPWGRDAGPVEQLVIDEEFRAAGIERPGLQIGAWVVPTLITYGSAEQRERWLEPTLLGELVWCQMFSEPGAGSDLAALSTKATKVDGGWLLTGQKVWTSLADRADLAITLARTDPDVPKHAGITYFVVDMHATGVDVRPLKELTGHAMFNEVFLSDVFVPDGNVVGEVGGGWTVARSTLANERVAMSSGTAFGGGLESLLAAVAGSPAADDPVVRDRLGVLLADGQSVSLLTLRATLLAVSGSDSGSAAVRKLIGVEHEQRVTELGLELLGPEGATQTGEAAGRVQAFLANRCLTIAGGTSEVQRNVIAERLLGLPRDPEPVG